jgi:protein tyrosine/serine phosphatase
MKPSIYWLEAPDASRLAIMPRPRAGDWLDDEVAGWKAAGIDLVVSLLEQSEVAELDLAVEAMLCQAANIDFVSFPIADRGVPASMKETEQLVRRISVVLADSKGVAVHCRAGIGRSSLIAACVLVFAGPDCASVFSAIAKARGLAVPDTDAQRAWVSEFQAAVAVPPRARNSGISARTTLTRPLRPPR